VTSELKEVSYGVEASESKLQVDCSNVDGKLVHEGISEQALRKLSGDAGKYLNVIVNKAVITVSAYPNDSQRQATKHAGKIAGLEVLRIMNEPTAASLAYGLEEKTNETIMVFEAGDGVCEALSTDGDIHLGGDTIVDWVAEES